MDDYSSIRFFSRYRGYPGFSISDFNALRLNALNRILTSDVVKKCFQDGACVSLVGVSLSEWETAHFGMPMARIEVMCSAEADVGSVSRTLSSALDEHRRSTGCRHYSAEIDLDDYPSMNACFSGGFEVLDFKRTYFTSRVSCEPKYKRFSSLVEHYNLLYRDEVLKLIGDTSFSTRFTRDKYLGKENSKQVYMRWFERLIDDFPEKSNVLIYKRDKRVVACGAIGEKDLSSEGVPRRIRTGSVYASRREGVGVYAAILRQLTEEAIESHGLVDTTVSLNSGVATRVVEGIRPNHSVAHCCLRKFFPD